MSGHYHLYAMQTGGYKLHHIITITIIRVNCYLATVTFQQISIPHIYLKTFQTV